jgi:hypothetical protein
MKQLIKYVKNEKNIENEKKEQKITTLALIKQLKK